MKKILYSVMALAIAAMTFTSCEDVPQPYPTPDPSTSGSNTEVEGATGDGSLENPFNSIAAISACKQLGSGGVSEQHYYIKGKVVSIATDKNDNVLNFDQGTYGNASFYISDDGTTTNQFYCYRVLYLGNKKWTQGSGDILKVGDEVIVCAKLTMYNTTPETQQNEGYLYSLNGKSEGGGGSEDTGTATGDGSQQNPFNAVAATNEAKKLASGAVSDKAYYIKGKVASIATDKNGNVLNFDQGTYGNASFYISDDGTATNQFYCYRVLYLGNKKWTQGAGDILKVGDEVIVCAKLTMYNTTPETQQNEGYLYSLNGKTEAAGGGDTPAPSGDLGTAEAPITVAKALEIINGYEAAGESATDAYVKGKIVSVQSYNDKYKSITYYISDDGTDANQLQVYSGKGLNGADFASKDDLKAGSVVVVKGKLKKYVKGEDITPEINQSSTIISIDGETGGGEQGGGEQGGQGEVSGNTITVAVSSFGLDNQTKLSSLTLSDGTTLTFDGGGNSNVPAYYTAGNGTIRMYPKNSFTINAGSKKISSIEIVCNEYNNTLYNASGNISVGSSNMNIDGTSLKASNINASSVTVTNVAEGSGAATQLRMETLKITYAE